MDKRVVHNATVWETVVHPTEIAATRGGFGNRRCQTLISSLGSRLNSHFADRFNGLGTVVFTLEKYFVARSQASATKICCL